MLRLAGVWVGDRFLGWEDEWRACLVGYGRRGMEGGWLSEGLEDFVGVGDREAVRDAGRVGMATHSQESIGHPMNIPTITCPSAIHQAVSAYACSSPARSLGSVGLCSMFSD